MVEKWSPKIEKLVKLDISRLDNNGEPILEQRWKAFATNKNKSLGQKMIEVIMNLFNIEIKDIKSQAQKELEEEKRLQKELLKERA